GHLFRRFGIDLDDPGVGAIGAQKTRRRLAFDIVVGRVCPAAGDQPKIFAPAFELMLRQCHTPSRRNDRLANVRGLASIAHADVSPPWLWPRPAVFALRTIEIAAGRQPKLRRMVGATGIEPVTPTMSR